MGHSPIKTADLYSTENLVSVLNLITEVLPDYLNNCQIKPTEVHQHQPGGVIYQRVKDLLDHPSNSLCSRIQEILSDLLLYSRQLQSPHYIGHQVAVPIPWAAALEGVSGVLNQGSAIFEMGPYAVAAERAIVENLARYISSEINFEGIVTNGGTLANLTALLAARNIHFKESFSTGNPTDKGTLAVICSEDAHYSISRSLGVMGLGSENVLKAPVDAATRKIDPHRLEDFYQSKVRQGYRVFAVVGSACSTPTGAIDDLAFLGDFCREHRLWFHVDAAHGGGFLLSNRLRPLFRGIEKADSVIWDAHKMMFVPALCTFVFFRDKKHSYQTFSQNAPYLFSADLGEADFESGLRTFECTKGNLVLPLLAVLSTIGAAGISSLLEKIVEMTQRFCTLLKESEDFEVLHDPQANILCFRFLPDTFPTDSLDSLQDQMRTALTKQSDFYITGTLLRGQRCLRITMMNPLTSESDLTGLMNNIRELFESNYQNKT